SIFIYSTELTFTDGITDGLIADKLYSIADTFEDYALLSYSENKIITLKLKPIGVKNYTIYFGNRSIVVNTIKTITFNPTENGVIVDGSGIENSGLNLNRTIKIVYGDNKFYIVKNISIPIN
ncbi:MAG: hypothetical protein ABGW92_03105, partial [Methanocaldococcus sp.]